MYRINIALVLTLVVVSVSSGLARDVRGKVGRFRLVTAEGAEVSGIRGHYTSTDFIFTRLDESRDTLSLDQVRSLDAYRGSRLDLGVTIGLAAGAVMGLVSIASDMDADREATYYADHGDRVIGRLALFTFGGGVIGMIVGQLNQRWERIPIDASLGFEPESSSGELAVRIRF